MADSSYFQKGNQAINQQIAEVGALNNLVQQRTTQLNQQHSVVDQQSGASLPVDNEEDLSLALVSGRYKPQPGQIFNVITPDGRRGTADAANIQKVLSSGQARLETAAETEQADAQEKYGSSDLEAAALGAARGTTFGLSDVFLKGGGFYKGEELKGLESANPVSSVVGEVGGIAAQTLLSGGESLAAKAASAPFKFSEALGAKAAAATAKSLVNSGVGKMAAESIAKRMLTTALPEAANLAAQGALQGAGRLVTENTFGTAELNAENLLAYAGMGAIVGGTFGGVVGTGKALVPSAKQLLETGVEKTPSLFSKEEAALNLADLSPAAIVKAEQKIPNFKAELANVVEDVINKEKPGSRELFHKAIASEKEVVGSTIGEFYKSVDKKIADVVNSGDTVLLNSVPEPTALGVSSNVMKAVDDHIAKLGISATEEQVNLLRKYGTNYAEKLGADLEKKGVSATTLQDYVKDMSASIYPKKPGGAPTMLTASEDSLKQLQRTIRETLRAEQRAVVRRAETLTGEPLVDSILALNKRYNVLSEVSYNSLKRAEEAGAKAGAVDDLLDFQITSPFRIIKKGLKSYTIQKAAVMQSLEKSLSTSDSSIERAISNIWKGAKTAASVSGKAGSTIAKAAEPVAVRQLTSYALASKMVDGKKVKATNEDEAYANIMENASRSLTDPESVLKESNRQTSAMFEHAPNTAGAIDAKYLQMMQYIASKSKKNNRQKGLFDVMKVEKVSSFEKARLNRYLEAMEDPMGTLKKAKSGQLSREHIDVIKNLYPEIHKKIKDVVMTKISKDKNGTLTYQQKLQMGLLLDLSPHESMSPQNIQGLQSTFEPAPEAQETPTNLKEFKRPDTMQTGIESHEIGD